MRALFRPATTFEGRRVPGLDEDEATMAVAAARALMRVRSVSVDSIQRLELVGPTETNWKTHVPIALGLRAANVAESSGGVVGPGTLRITVHAPRIGATGSGSSEALAVAEVAGDAKDVDASEQKTRDIDRAKAEKILAWESKALLQTPMGAYIPKATWDASLDARYRLVAGFCPSCRRGQHPRIDPCPFCGGKTTERELKGPGSLYTNTVIAAGGGPTEFDAFQETDGTYGVAIVDFGDAIRVAGILTETELASLHIGQRMEPVFRRLYAQEGAWRYGTKFRIAKQG
jgi:uncharacterized protein